HHALSGLDPQRATENIAGGSSFAWTAAHVANQVDAWVNVRFQNRPPHPLIGQTRFRVGGAGTADDWQPIQIAVSEVRDAARSYLREMADRDLDLVIPYEGPCLRLPWSG